MSVMKIFSFIGTVSVMGLCSAPLIQTPADLGYEDAGRDSRNSVILIRETD